MNLLTWLSIELLFPLHLDSAPEKTLKSGLRLISYPLLHFAWLKSYVFANSYEWYVRIPNPVFNNTRLDTAVFCNVFNCPEFFREQFHLSIDPQLKTKRC